MKKKQCSCCERILPLSEFRPRPDSKDGYRPQCKACRRAAHNPKVHERKQLLTQGLKRCTSCDRILSLTAFNRHAGHKIDNRASRCHECRKDMRRSDKAKERVCLLAQGLKRCPKCGMIKPLDGFYPQKGSTRDGVSGLCRFCHSASKRPSYQQNREIRIKQSVEWIKNNPEKRRAIVERYRAHKKQSGGSFTDEDIAARLEAQCGLCVYCQSDLSKGYHVDHIVPLSRGGDNNPANLQLLCAHCNCSKRAKTHEEFLTYRNRF